MSSKHDRLYNINDICLIESLNLFYNLFCLKSNFKYLAIEEKFKIRQDFLKNFDETVKKYSNTSKPNELIHPYLVDLFE